MDIVRENSPKFLTPREFYQAYKAKVGLAFIYGALQNNEIRHVKLGRKLLILASEVSDWPVRAAGGKEA